MHYLKSTIKAEPLIWKWYAWPYLIPPHTSAANIVHRHIKIMESFIQNPMIHKNASKNPALIGGPFMDLDTNMAADVEELLQYTKGECKDLIALDQAIKNLDHILQQTAYGFSLDELYDQIPDLLGGCVELVYDINNHPSIRFLEDLIYQKFYTTKNQSILLSKVKNDFRKFVLSTPKISNTSENELLLSIPYSDQRLDILFSSEFSGCNLEEMVKLLSINEDQIKLFSSLFTTEPKKKKNKSKNFRIRYFGHACILLETQDISILFDPVISYLINNTDDRFTFEDLPDKIDFVVITHNHQDHLLFETLLKIRHKIGTIVFPSNNNGFICDPSIKLILKNIGFKSLCELKEFDIVETSEGFIQSIPFFGEHSDLNIQSKSSYFLKIKNKKILILADSNNLDKYLYKNLRHITGDVDLIFLGMECDGAPLSWLYGPMLSTKLQRNMDYSRKLSGSNFEKAIAIVEEFSPKEAYVYAMGQEPWLGYIMGLIYTPDSLQITESNKFVYECQKRNIKSERLYLKKEWIF
jgi:L-ascorbate metabolism protein UlaG (beta-lactamase superfamily)